MNPVSVKCAIQGASDQSERLVAPLQQVFMIRELFSLISLQADPRTSLSIFFCSRDIVKAHEGAFEEVNELFNRCLGIKIQKENSLFETLREHQCHIDSIREAVEQRIRDRNMAPIEEIERLCWCDLPLLKEWIAASDKLQVWKALADAICDEEPSIANLTEINGCIAEGDKFSEWFGKNSDRLEELELLDLRGLGLAALPAEIGQLTRLQSLELGSNQLANFPVEIGQLTSLKALGLGGNQLTALPVEIGQLSELEKLHLGNNKLGELPIEIGQLAQLKTLELSGNSLTALPATIGNLAALDKLFLRSNELTELPIEIGQLTRLQMFDLSDNQLTELSIEIGQLTRLQGLNLSGNQFKALPIVIEQLKENGCDVRVC